MASELATGDPFFCKGCKAIFSKFSKITQVEQKPFWFCEFCNTKNEVDLEEEEIPKTDTVNYIVEAAPSANAKKAGAAQGEDTSIIFCLDISGSMCVSAPITGKHNIKGDRKNDLK